VTNPDTPSSSGLSVDVDFAPEVLRLLPVQVVELDDGIVLKRGVTTVRFSGQQAAEIVHCVLDGIAAGLDLTQLRGSFAEPHREAVDDLIAQLRVRRILVADGDGLAEQDHAESSLEVFYWNFDVKAELVAQRVGAGRITVLGVNEVSRRLVGALAASGVRDFDVVDYHLLRNVDAFDADGALLCERWGQDDHVPEEYETWANCVENGQPRCIVATSDFGATQAIRQWNSFCVDNTWHFLPVILQDLVGYVGPLVIPGQTACYECLRARQNSHMQQPVAQRAPESQAFEGQGVLGFHPSMAGVLGDLAAMELMKFYGRLPLWQVGHLVEVNLMAPSLLSRRVLRVPRCSACGALRTRSSTNLHASLYRLNE
jgi:bacteriocin biosynthesis cyclodehydratase domain-containing protein